MSAVLFADICSYGFVFNYKQGESMKNIFNRIQASLKKFKNDESGQGSAEYILLIALVVAVVMMFGPRIRTAIQAQTEKVEGEIQNANF